MQNYFSAPSAGFDAFEACIFTTLNMISNTGGVNLQTLPNYFNSPAVVFDVCKACFFVYVYKYKWGRHWIKQVFSSLGYVY